MLPGANREDGKYRGLRSRFRIKELGKLDTVSALSMGFGIMDGSDCADVPTTNNTAGQPFYQPMRVTGSIHKDNFPTLQQWIKDVYDGKENVKRMTMTYELLHPQLDEAIKSFILHECHPTAFNYIEAESNGAEVMKFDLSFHVTRIEMQS
jgi:hypothetical protein